MTKLVLHVGLPKTGTTSLQRWMSTDARLSSVALIPSRQAQLAADGGAGRREELRGVIETWSRQPRARKVSRSANIESRVERLASQIRSYSGTVVFSEEMLTAASHTDVRLNAHLLGRVVRKLRAEGHLSEVSLAFGTRVPVDMLDSASAFLLSYRKLNRETAQLENFFREAWNDDAFLVYRPAECLQVFLNEVAPDTLVILPLEMLKSNSREFHRRLGLLFETEFPDLPLSRTVENARPVSERGYRSVKTLPPLWGLLRSVQENLERCLGSRILKLVPRRCRILLASALHRSVQYTEQPPFSDAFVAWYLDQIRDDYSHLRGLDTSIDWRGLGYPD